MTKDGKTQWTAQDEALLESYRRMHSVELYELLEVAKRESRTTKLRTGRSGQDAYWNVIERIDLLTRVLAEKEAA
jgi:hypothetical protein